MTPPPNTSAPRTVAPPRRAGAWLVMAFLAAALASGALFTLARGGPPPLPRLGRVASFALTDQTGRPFTQDALAGQAWIASFLFTRCPTVCPLATARLARLQGDTAEAPAPRIVSFSVDPEHDTPERLRAYGERFGADFARWSFLTGPLAAVRTTVVDGLKVSMDGRADGGDVSGLLHGTRFVLVDGGGEIRGYYASDDPDALALLRDHARQLSRFPR